MSDETHDLPAGSTHRIESPEHALLAGMVWGLAMKHGLDLLPVLDDEGNYSAEAELVLPEPTPGVRIRLVVQPAPRETIDELVDQLVDEGLVERVDE